MNREEANFAGWVHDYLDGTLREPDREALFDRIRRSPEAARHFARQLRLEAGLEQEVRGPVPRPSARPVPAAAPRREPDALPAPGWPVPLRPALDHLWGPATAVLLHAALLLLILRWTLPEPGREAVSPAAYIARKPAPLDPLADPAEAVRDPDWLLPGPARSDPAALPPSPEAARFARPQPAVVRPEDTEDVLPVLPALFATRSRAGRQAGNDRLAPDWGLGVESAARRGFRWLAARQLPDGGWMDAPENAVRVAALSAAAGLAYAPGPADPVGQMVLRAASFIQSQQMEDGRFDPDPGAHAAAVLALAELRILWRFPGEGPALQRGIEALIRNVESDYIAQARDPAAAAAAMAWPAHALGLLLELDPGREGLRLAAAKLVAKIKTYHDPASGHFRIPAARTAAERTRMMAAAVSALQVLGEGRSAECLRARRRLLRQPPAEFAAELALLAPEHLFFLFDAMGRSPQPGAAPWLSAAAARLFSLQEEDGGWSDGTHSPDLLLTASAALALSAHFRAPHDPAGLAEAGRPAPPLLAVPGVLAALAPPRRRFALPR